VGEVALCGGSAEKRADIIVSTVERGVNPRAKGRTGSVRAERTL
jgi:hypothetical protein